jgi:hypothetical protein
MKAKTKETYTVWCHVNNVVWFPLIHRRKTEFSFRTAVRLAEKYATEHKTVCKVLPTNVEFLE